MTNQNLSEGLMPKAPPSVPVIDANVSTSSRLDEVEETANMARAAASQANVIAAAAQREAREARKISMAQITDVAISRTLTWLALFVAGVAVVITCIAVFQ